MPAMEILIVSGLSGAGKSTCLRALEDLGYYCVDNLPVPLLPALVASKLELERSQARPRPLAVGVDARANDHLHAFAEVRERLLGEGHSLELLFLEAPDSTLVRRFSETRRRHPLGELPGAIGRERERLAELRALADSVIDSENLRSRQLRQLIRDRYATRGGVLHLVLMSFGFKNGLPSEADLVFDARFLQNPFDVPELRAKGGFDGSVRDFVLAQDDARELLERIEGWLRFQAPRTISEGRSYLTVALGCTGGQHRSVALVEALHQRCLAEPLAQPAPVLSIRHRDLEQALADTAHLG
ncbi:RNase adapter RapZ [Pseudenhygromyxa sp. WMMC2535]|uniref:RNase adapter RapZ n=1 Tax=Pseudenhygromyxa sp. WMMC2535 TaxID=2712867 RepID=UPI001551CADE|nr:RNase adapter RapZ [Pseudenhygromyxa sp. WMMC2535]NVB40123.1 RNase adapter RapZ [Pseudenhygromyxa sp. WMMC2535]